MTKKKTTVKKTNMQCYTIIKTIHIGGDVFVKWSRLKMKPQDALAFGKNVALTSSIKNDKDAGCGC